METPKLVEITVDKKNKKRKYSLEFKIAAISAAEKDGNRPVASRLNINESRIREWRKQKSLLRSNSVTSNKFRISGGGRKIINCDIELQLKSEVLIRREQQIPVTCKWIMERAKALFEEKMLNGLATEQHFNASKGWLHRFMIRNRFTTRQASNSQELPSDVVLKLTDFVLSIRKHQLKNKYDLNSIFACHETSVWVDMPPDNTDNSTGMDQISIKTSFDKRRITLMLCAKANGSKCYPYLLLNRSCPLPILETTFPQINFGYNTTGRMSNDQTKEFLFKTLELISFSKKLLVWDTFQCQICDETKFFLRQLKADMVVIPAGCTSLIQPGDISWSKPFKAHLANKYVEWLSKDEIENMQPAPLELVCDWISQAWESLPTNLIINSFRCCGIGLKTDGSDDFEITCFQDGNKCASGKKILAQNNAKLNNDIETINESFKEEDMNENVTDLKFLEDLESDDEICVLEETQA